MASIDLDWTALDENLATTLIDILNKQLASTTRPSFMGPISILGFEFGSSAPDVQLIDICDIYPDFLLDDDSSTSDEADFHGQESVKLDSRPVSVGRTPGMNPSWNVDEASQLDRQPTGRSTWPQPSVARQDFKADISDSGHPDLQLHLRMVYESDLRITLSTSLLINFPSPSFMALPLKLAIVGLTFEGEFVMAYEGSRRRVHVCIVDEQDPASGPLLKRSTGEAGDNPTPRSDSTKPLPIGERLLPNIYIESEIGQVDKHVLKNVSRVERFIQDVMRKAIEDELVFPNFQTLVLPDSTRV